MKAWYSKAMCEKCGRQPAVSFSFIENRNLSPEPAQDIGEPISAVALGDFKSRSRAMKEHRSPSRGNWFFTCACTSDNEMYYVEFSRFFRRPQSTVDWMAHLHEKLWFNPEDWGEMMVRFRKAADCFSQI